LAQDNAFGVDDDESGTHHVDYVEDRAKTLFFVWATLTEHKWVILRERRGYIVRSRVSVPVSVWSAAELLRY
jgi:hypothetical protein